MVKTKIVDKTLFVSFTTDKKNTVNPKFAKDFHLFIKNLKSSSFNVIVFTSEGPFFSNGFDPIHLIDRNESYLIDFLENAFGLLVPLFNLDIPTIAMIQGHAMGWGAIFSLFCDFRFMANKKARIGFPEANIGLSVPISSVYRLTDLVGFQKARDLCYFGSALKPLEAIKIGLVDQIFNPEDLLNETLKFAGKLNKYSKWSLSGNKVVLQHQYRNCLYTLVKEDVLNAPKVILHPEAQEGLTGLFENSRPKFNPNKLKS